MIPGIFLLIRRWKKMGVGIVVDHGFCKYLMTILYGYSNHMTREKTSGATDWTRFA